MSYPASSKLRLLDLPTELLVEIVWHSHKSNLLLVCRDLHNIICSTPRFWGTIRIGKKQLSAPDGPSFLRNHLERGAAWPLDISVESPCPSANLLKEEMDMCHTFSPQKDRIRSLDICTFSMLQAGVILNAILLAPKPSAHSSLKRLNLRHISETYLRRDRRFTQPILGPISSLFPALTTLVLPMLKPCIPILDTPLLSLTTLVLTSADGAYDGIFMSPLIDATIDFLAMTPHLERLWCKQPSFHARAHDSDKTALLPRLTSIAVTAPGIGMQLLQHIHAPMLRQLHVDGTRPDDGDEWLDPFSELLRSALQTTASRSPALRRLALVGAYLRRDAWEWLLGCGDAPALPFPLLESIAVRAMEAFKWQVTNAVDNELLELYAWKGRIPLRRLVYLESEPQLGGAALHQLLHSIIRKQPPGEFFEIELDGYYGEDTQERLASLLEIGVKAVLHADPVHRRSWWTMTGKDIDPSEENSY